MTDETSPLPVVAWAMIACLESRHVNDFVRHSCKDGMADARAVENQETIDLIARGSIDALKKGVGAFCQECVVVQTDFTEEARNTRHKFHILHGNDDRIIPLAHSRAFAADVPGTSVEVVDEAGPAANHYQKEQSIRWQRGRRTNLGHAGHAPADCPSSNDLRLFGLWKNGVSGSVCWLI